MGGGGNTELLKVEDVHTHACAKFSRTCAMCTFESEIGKTGIMKKKIGTIGQNSLNV